MVSYQETRCKRESDSRAGLGFSLPAARSAGAKIDCVAASVLIVDDDPSFRELAERLLIAAGLDVVGQADSIGAGISAAQAMKPDAILLDVMLPDGDGVALAREFTALSWGPRVLLTSSSEDAAGRGEIEGSGAVAFLPKSDLPGAPLERLLGGA
jgi:two-component system response regulator VicR